MANIGFLVIFWFNCKHFIRSTEFAENLSLCTVPIDKILCVKNARAWVSMVSYLKK